MKVADLQQYFTDLAKLLQSVDGKKSSSELAKIAEALQPFRNYDFSEFGAFLARAEHFDRTGDVPIVPPKPARGSKSPNTPKADVSALRDEVKQLYGTASSPGVTIESIEELRPKLEGLTKPELLTIAEAIGLVGIKSKSKADILNTIVNRIKSIKQSAMRTSIIDRPGTTY